MGVNDLYEVELITRVNDIFCRNLWHFVAHLPGATAESIVDHWKDGFYPAHRNVFSSFADYIQVSAKLVNDPVVDSYSWLYQGETGNHNALPIDPRICVYVRLNGHPERGQYSQGGLYLSGVPSDWAPRPPKLDIGVIVAYQQAVDAWVAGYGADSPGLPMRWGIVSKRIKSDPSKSLNDYFFPVREGRIRPYFAMLKTRRPRGPF
jgi:hypothetical protein